MPAGLQACQEPFTRTEDQFVRFRFGVESFQQSTPQIPALQTVFAITQKELLVATEGPSFALAPGPS